MRLTLNGITLCSLNYQQVFTDSARPMETNVLLKQLMLLLNKFITTQLFQVHLKYVRVPNNEIITPPRSRYNIGQGSLLLTWINFNPGMNK